MVKRFLVLFAVSQVYFQHQLNLRMSICLSICVTQILWGSLETSKKVGFGWNFAHLFLGWISGLFFYFSKNLIFGAQGRVFAKRNVCYSLPKGLHVFWLCKHRWVFLNNPWDVSLYLCPPHHHLVGLWVLK